MTRVVKSVDQSGLDGPTCRMKETRCERTKEMSGSINEWETSAMLIFPGDINLLHLRSTVCPTRFWSGAVLRRLKLLFPLRRLPLRHSMSCMECTLYTFARCKNQSIAHGITYIHTGRPYRNASCRNEL